MLEQTAIKNEYGPYQNQSLKILSDIVSQYPNKLLLEHCPHLHRILLTYILLTKPNDISIQLHYDSFVCNRSLPYFTPQAAGNTTPRDLILTILL